MEPLFWVVAIFGCADGHVACQPVLREPARFESKTACLAAMQDKLPQYGDLPYPELEGRCEARGLQIASR